MSLIISQTGVSRLPEELVNNAAFVKQIDFDPVHQVAKDDQPAEKINSMAGRFDTISISAEALAKVKDIQSPSSAEGKDALSMDTEADKSEPLRQKPSVLDITDPASVERKRQGDAIGEAMRSWNATVKYLKQVSESSKAYGYAETVRLFKNGYADWKAALQKSDPEAYGAWMRMLEEDK